MPGVYSQPRPRQPLNVARYFSQLRPWAKQQRLPRGASEMLQLQALAKTWLGKCGPIPNT